MGKRTLRIKYGTLGIRAGTHRNVLSGRQALRAVSQHARTSMTTSAATAREGRVKT
jgi:hypothetical protein